MDKMKEKTTASDVGNGLIILGCILLVIFLTLSALALFVYADGGWKVWTYPSISGFAGAATAVLIITGAILRYFSSSKPEERTEEE